MTDTCIYFRHVGIKGTASHKHMCVNIQNVTHRCGFDYLFNDFGSCPIVNIVEEKDYNKYLEELTNEI